MTTLVFAAISFSGACGGDECTTKTCGVDLAAGHQTNRRTFEKCYSGTTPITITLRDKDGKPFYECTYDDGKSCVQSTVDAMFAYCEVR